MTRARLSAKERQKIADAAVDEYLKEESYADCERFAEERVREFAEIVKTRPLTRHEANECLNFFVFVSKDAFGALASVRQYCLDILAGEPIPELKGAFPKKLRDARFWTRR